MPNQTTTYSVSANVTSSNVVCPASNTVLVTVHPTPTISPSSDRPAKCKNESVTLSAIGGTSYTWQASTGALGTGASVTYTNAFLGNIPITVTGTDANGCVGTGSISLLVSACNDLREQPASRALSVFPNPNNGNFIVTAQSEVSLRMVNQLGQSIRHFTLEASNGYQAEMTGLSEGVYYLVNSDSKQVAGRVVVLSNR
jgi:hypothetical protein